MRIALMGKTGINLENVKMRNRSTILRLLNSKGAMSRKDIAAEVGLTPAAVTQLCTEMIEDGYLAEKGEMQEEKRAGRRKVLVAINYEYRYVAALSIETQMTYITICDMRGNAVCGKKIPTDTKMEPTRFLEMLARESKALMWENGTEQAKLLGVGICIPGIVDRKRGISLHAYGIWHEEVPVKELMEAYMKCPVIVENNVKAFAEGELVYGLGRTGDNLLFIKWGPGVGSAIVVRNQIYEGKDHKAAEIGHYIIEPNGLPCRCGRKGCLETRVSIGAIVEKIKAVYSREKTPNLYAATDGEIEQITEDSFTAWVEENADNSLPFKDEAIKQILEESIERLARVIVNVITILAPEHAIVFGAMLENDRIRDRFMKYCQGYDIGYDEEYIQKSKLSKKIYYIGATAIVTRELFFEMGTRNLG